MWGLCALMFAAWSASGADAFAPIRWTGSSVEKLFLMPRASFPLQNLRISDGLDAYTGHMLPSFEMRPDHTLVWKDTDLCIEAAGDQVGDVVRVNHCTGAPGQKWDWIPDASGHGMIQLKGTSKCVDVVDQNGEVNQIAIDLQECDNQAVAPWRFESVSLAHGSSPSPLGACTAQHAVISLMLFIGTLTIGTWIFRWRSRANAVIGVRSGVPLGIDTKNAIALMAPSAFYNCNRTPPCSDLDVQRVHEARASLVCVKRAHVSMNIEVGEDNAGTEKNESLAKNLDSNERWQVSKMSTANLDLLPAIASLCVDEFGKLEKPFLPYPGWEEKAKAKWIGGWIDLRRKYLSGSDPYSLVVVQCDKQSDKTWSGLEDKVLGFAEISLLPAPPEKAEKQDNGSGDTTTEEADGDYPYVANIFVVPKARRLGVGRAVALAAQRTAVELGYNRMYIKVDRMNLDARRLYDKLGYRLVYLRSRMDRGYEQTGVDMYLRKDF